MNQRLFDVIVRNEIPTFVSLVQENPDILEQKTLKSSNTALHLAATFGHVELVRAIIKLSLDMVAAENEKKETPLHIACWQGNAEVVSLLLKTQPSTAFKLNCKSQSALFMACINGHLSLVKLLLNWSPRLLDLEDGIDESSLHVATSRGYTDIVREILNVQPNFAWKTDKNGSYPLHNSSSRGHLEITKILLMLDQKLAVQYDEIGHTPVHSAAMNGKTEILKEFVLMAPASFQFQTREGETVFHLIVRYNHYDAFMCLEQVFHNTKLINSQDQYGSTILHLAASGQHLQIVNHLINKETVDINSQNCQRFTALDMIDKAAEKNSETLSLESLLINAGGKRSTELLPLHSLGAEGKSETHISSNNNVRTRLVKEMSISMLEALYREDMHQSAVWNTIMVVASALFVATFPPFMSPPGGVYQDGSLKGQSIAGRTTAFKVFSISNYLSFFISLSMAPILLFRKREPMDRRLLPVAQIIMCTGVAFFATAAVAASLVTMHNTWSRDKRDVRGF